MGRGFIICLWFVLGGIFFSLKAQQHLEQDSVILDKATIVGSEKPIIVQKPVLVDSTIHVKEEFKPDPTKAVIYSAIFPGLGQIYNRKYWKLPLVYGGFVGFVYGISWNGGMYNSYSRGYRDLVTGSGESWHDFLRPGETPQKFDRESLTSSLRRKKDFFRRNRDLAIIGMVAFYAVCMIDAYVDANLYDFNMSPDLSMRVEPVLWGPSQNMKASVGLQCSINF